MSKAKKYLEWIWYVISGKRRAEKKRIASLTTKEFLSEARQKHLGYEDNPFRTHMSNMIQRIRGSNWPDAADIKFLTEAEVKERLNSGKCWIDYREWDRDGNEIPGSSPAEQLMAQEK